ncbi:mechanosensitive ion channel domain-containing protein [Desulfonema magnum]|uniref:Mechanosensitive ion channel domain-containing protein n=1 Tax=Desulfonema magnum TaxID=45655 RepID=A0A975BMB2_9BACT|nr:mechanosensitive ion channel domain-containing protein [Desulfonema magnum]QTA87798.1 Mechanosensitive ion channel domain-containing protein [Desulfonema magnum]
MKRINYQLSILSIVLIFCCSLSMAAAETKKKDKAGEKPELHNLGNEELLGQAQSIFNQASDTFLAQLRGLRKSEKLFQQASQERASLIIPEETPPTSVDDTDTLEAAKKALEHAKVRLDAFNHQLELIQAEKTFADRRISQLEAAKSATDAFMNVINGLDLFLFEIRLRVEDGTLSPDKVPDSFSKQNLKKQKQELILWQRKLKRKAEAAQGELRKDSSASEKTRSVSMDNVFIGHSLKTINSHLEEAKKKQIEAKARHASAEEKYARELNRQTLEKEYSGQSPRRLIIGLSELQEERVWFSGAFNLSYSRFIRAQENAIGAEEEIEAISPPETTEILRQEAAVRTEEMEQAVKQVDDIAAYHSDRIGKLEELRSSLQSVVKRGEIFLGDATVLSEHLSRMQVLAKILKDFGDDGKIRPEEIPEGSRSEALVIISEETSKLVSDALSAIQKAKGQVDQIAQDIEKSEKAREEAKDRLAQLKKTYDSAQKARQWDAELKNLTAQDILQKFHESAEKIQTNMTALEKVREAYEKARTSVRDIIEKLESLKDPVVRSVQKESADEKQNILRKLWHLAGMKIPDEIKKKVLQKPETTVKPSDAFQQERSDGLRAQKEAETAVKPSDASQPQQYQDLLSARVRVIRQQQKYRVELLNALNAQNQEIEKYSKVLSEATKLSLQYHANAVELKKRLGRKQLSSRDIPDTITEALKRDRITRLETRMSELMTHQTEIRQRIETVSQPDKTLEERQTLLTETLSSVGKRIDMLRELEKLNKDFERKREALSQTELQSLQQMAVRTMESEDTPKEYLLSFVPSGRAKHLTMLLEAYYQELTELDAKQKILKRQTHKTERLIQLADQEKDAVSKLLPFLRKQMEQLEVEKEEAWVKIQARLMPQKAEEILGNFETKTGRRLPLPPPITEEKKADTVFRVADFFFERHIEIVAANKWFRLFEQRLSATGIGTDIGKYQDNLAALNAENAAIQRRIQAVKGRSHKELAKLGPEENPRTAIEKLRFLKGEVGVLRADRYKTRRQQAVWVFVRLAGIFLTAMLFSWLVKGLVARSLRRYQNADGKKESEKNITLAALLPLMKTILIFIIWGVAIISGLNTLGFNVGAILAGLGIGGFAIAMASKETLGDIIGGISIFISKSFNIGDVILFKGEKAEVEEIGLQYTRLRQNATKFMITVPNSQLSQSEVINLTKSPAYFVNIEIPLSTRNTMVQLKLAVKLLTEIIDKNPNTKLKNMRLRTFDNYSFNLALRYLILDISLRHTMRTEIHTEIVRQFQENNIEFAVRPYLNVEKLGEI